jgi:DNA-binding MarR family transcriptional regulator
MYHARMDRNTTGKPAAELVEQAMVAIRRRQSRRALAGRAERDHGATASVAVTEVLDVVEDNAGAVRPTTVTDLGRRLGSDQPRASKLAAQAITAGLLRRAADQHDGRRSLLELTAAGRRQLDLVHGYRRAQFARAMSGWTDAERETFAGLLTRFVTALDRADAEAAGLAQENRRAPIVRRAAD